ncbi:AraC family transcriptional regulator [Parabacteroides sp. 52]|uniref:AraC family transcriptional regulator n=1 Tax=unclassified Parabacteroides TaxID=2649774 RepID=UPI0013D53F21|nr:MULTISPECIES: AraC family transcriptional regulator [unclassified Parabacteroides]MDH6535154.1 AraC-like DNA-binding protein [Parabacteroides sp. PM5-20]NDV56194.1 AraC family transcriptional regulator [Parabacteroides sp. 52]
MITKTTDLFKEVSPLSCKDCFIVIERLKNTFNFPIHIHPECELNFIEHAKGAQRIVGDSVETIGEKELVLITNPKLEHAWVNHRCKSQTIHEITVQFHSSSIPGELLEKNPFQSIKLLFERAQKGVVFGIQTINKIRPLLKTLSCETDSFYSVLKLLSILHELSLAEDVRTLASSSFLQLENSPEEDPRINKVVTYLNQNYQQQVRLSDVASLVNMSEPSFCRFMKQCTSKSFVDFLTDTRMGVAIRLLIDSSQSVADIGYACGFNNLSNFNRIFKKKKGMPPSEFRENYRKKKVIV